MAKSKLMAIIIAAVVVVGGTAVAVPMIKNMKSEVPEESSTQISGEASTEIYEEPVTEIQHVTEIETVTDNAGKAVVDEGGNVITSIKNITRIVTKAASNGGSGDSGSGNGSGSGNKTSANKKDNSTRTTKKNSGNKDEKQTYADYSDTGIWYVDALGRGLNSMEKQAVLGYAYNSEGDYFYTDDKDCWQVGFGYNEVYDQAAAFGCMWIDQLRIRFDYEDKPWMIELWKGQYGWVFVGAEIGVYTGDFDSTADVNPNDINHYNCAAQSDWLNMSMDVFWDDDRDGDYTRIFSREYGKYWWCTGFKFGTCNRFSSPITELIMNARITFKSERMATLFTKGMKNSGFSSAASNSNLANDSIFQSGADVYLRWKSVIAKTYVDNISARQSEKASEKDNKTAPATVHSGKED